MKEKINITMGLTRSEVPGSLVMGKNWRGRRASRLVKRRHPTTSELDDRGRSWLYHISFTGQPTLQRLSKRRE